MAMMMRINKLNAHIQEIKMLDTTIAVGKPSCYCTKVYSIMFRKSTHKVMKIGKKFDSVVKVNMFFSLCKSTFSIPRQTRNLEVQTQFC